METKKPLKATDLEVCNRDCLKHASRKTGESLPAVTAIITHLSTFVGDRLWDPNVESMQVPSFGKFKAKPVNYQTYAKPL